MAGITLAQAQTKLDNAMTALDAAMQAQSFSIGDGGTNQSQSRASVDELQKAVNYWEKRVIRLTRGGIRVMQVTTDA